MLALRNELNPVHRLVRYAQEWRELARVAGRLSRARDGNEARVILQREGWIVADPPKGAWVENLWRLMTVLGVSVSRVRNREPMVLERLERTCEACGQRSLCDGSLDAGTARANYEAFCPNAPTLRRLAP
jgi:hypothetical protein